MKRSFKKFLAVLLISAIFITGIPISAFANDNSSSILKENEITAQPIDNANSEADSSSPPEESTPPDSKSVSLPAKEGNSALHDQEQPISSLPQSIPSVEDCSSEEQTPEKDEQEQNAFVPLSITKMSTTFSGKHGDVVDFFVRLNRDDVAVTYQWQRLYCGKEYDGNGVAVHDYDGGESTRYIFPFEGITEAELLEMNPDATWQGIEMYIEKAKISENVTIKPNTPNYILNSDAASAVNEKRLSLDMATPSSWINIDGANSSIYYHTVTDEDIDSFYRCVVTITDENYLAELNASKEPVQAMATMEENSSETPAEAIDETLFMTNNMFVEVQDVQADEKLMTTAYPRLALPAPRLSFDKQWIMNVDESMEYITADTYVLQSASAANNPYWTKLSGGRRYDNSQYKPTSIKDNNINVLSAWYGKTIYVRKQGDFDKGTPIEIPAYTETDYQTGKETLYKYAIKTLNVYIPDSGGSYYATYLSAISDKNGYLLDSNKNQLHQYPNITVDKMEIDVFNVHPDWVLTDAEGNYKYDLVSVGVCTDKEPDLSGAAAWALRDYIGAGYGFMVGHDTMYGYGGVTNFSYEPDKNSTVTPYYKGDGSNTGHFNMNWLMGINKTYHEASPYEAPSLILNIGNYSDKSTMYGDPYDKSELRIAKTVSHNGIPTIAQRCPTNYPYSKSEMNTPFDKDFVFQGSATHTNQQIAYGTIWLDYASNTMPSVGAGQLVTDKNNGLIGTNNFYLTTNGNFGMNQIGHVKNNQNIALINEVYILANTIMYLSQRQQCQVCQSEQGGNKKVNFVRRIQSIEQLAMLRDINNWYNYPKDGCYMLSNNITLPADWAAIENFSGHFNADNKTITAPDGVSLFAQKGSLGDFSNGTSKGWNLGEDSTKGINSIVTNNTAKARTTGVARVAGYLHELFGTENGNAYSGYRVEVVGTDGVTYSCLANSDGKYVISNLPCTGVMTAHVYNKSNADITSYGKIRANVPKGFWNTNETTPLYLLGFTALPVKNVEIYENETAIMTQGGVNSASIVTDITWEYSTDGGKSFKLVEGNIPNASVTSPIFHALGDASWTETKLTIPNALASFSGYVFRAIFKKDGRTTDTYSVGKEGYMGLLTIKARPMYVKHPQNTEKWLDETAIFTAESEYFLSTDNPNFTVKWEYRTNTTGLWYPVSGDKEFAFATISNKVSEGTTNPTLAPFKTTSTLRLSSCKPYWNTYQFRAVFTATSTGVSKETSYGTLTVKDADITVSSATDQTLMLASNGIASGTATYTSRIIYRPGKTEVNTPSLDIAWKYSGGKGNYRNPQLRTWSQSVANSQAVLLGAPAPIITINNTAPVSMGNGQYYIDSTMTIKNVSALFDEGNTRYYFSCTATAQFNTSICSATSEKRAALILDYSCDIKFNEGVKSDDAIDEKGDFATWTFPKLTVNAGRSVYTCIIRFEEGKYNLNDTLSSLAALPGDMKKTVVTGQYLMLTSVNGISADSLQAYLRQVTWKSYDKSNATSSGASIYAYIDCAKNLATRSSLAMAEAPRAADTITIVAQPKSVTVALKKAATFTAQGVSSSGQAVQYQWQVSTNNGATWSDLEGEISSVLTINPALNLHHSFKYRCVMGTLLAPKSATSSAATLSISSDKKLIPNVESVAWRTSVNGGGSASTAYDALYISSYDYNDALGFGEAYLDIDLSSFSSITFTYELTGYNGHGLPGDYNGDAQVIVNGTWLGNSTSGTKTISISGSKVSFKAVSVATSAPVEAHWKITDITLKGSGGGGDEDANLIRTDYSAFDRSVIYTASEPPANVSVSVNISAHSKVYNGTEVNAVITLTPTIGNILPETLTEILSRASVTYSNGKTTQPNKTGSDCINADNYTATIAFSATDVLKYKLTGDKSCSFTITKRPINLYSHNNDKPYDKTGTAVVRNILFEPLNESASTGVITADISKVSLDRVSFSGKYADFHQTNNKAVPIERAETLGFIGTLALNYKIGIESYTGKITPRGLLVHSLYLENPNKPRNIKAYDGTKNAVISDIVIDNIILGDTVALNKQSCKGEYDTKNAGETLTSDGKTQENRLQKLKENPITRTESIALVNNEYGDYTIISESYSGAITRSTLLAQVMGMGYHYGVGMQNTPRFGSIYTNTVTGYSTNLAISSLAKGDILRLDGSKVRFTYPEITKQTPVGLYPLEFEGLTEENYPLLSNYIVWYTGGYIEIMPRRVRITMQGGYEKEYGETNPKFTSKIEYHIPGAFTLEGEDMFYEGLPANDTPETAFDGALTYNTKCNWQSDVIWANDNRTHLPYPVTVSGYTPKLNINGRYNYELEYVNGNITVHPTEITVTGVDKVKTYGNNDPFLEYTLSRPRVKPEDLPYFGASRMLGEDVGLYKIRIDHFYDPNYIIKEGRPTYLEIIPATLFVNANNCEKLYGDDNPHIYTWYSGFKNGDSELNAIDGNAYATTTAKKKSPVGAYSVWPVGMSVRKNSNGYYNYDLIDNGGYMVIHKRTIDIYAEAKIKTIGEKDPILTWHLREDQFQVDDEFPIRVNLTRRSREQIGKYPIYITPDEMAKGHDVNCSCLSAWDNPNYDIRYHSENLTIKEKDILIAKVKPTAKVYGNENPQSYQLEYILNGVERSAEYCGIVGTPVFETECTIKSYVGEYEVSVSGLSSSKYGEVQFESGILTVTPRPIKVKGKYAEKNYGDAEPDHATFGYRITDTLTGKIYANGRDVNARINVGDLAGNIDRAPGENATVYYYNAGDLANDKNYTIEMEQEWFQIRSGWMMIVMEEEYFKTEGEENPQFKASFYGLLNGDTVEKMSENLIFVTECNKNSPAGDYIVYPYFSKFGVNENNYAFNFISTFIRVKAKG